MSDARKILITAALPYANGDLHLGHMVEYTMADIWNRFFKMMGHQSCYLCADDTHGTPIMINAKKRGLSPEAMVADFQQRHLKDFEGFHIEFDHYSSTNSKVNQRYVEEIFEAVKQSGHIEMREIEQSYCNTCSMFLPDRFVRGTCPKCKAADQYGDNCEVCSATYSPLELIEARCATCNSSPVAKKSEHFFFKLKHFQEFLREWVPSHTNDEIARKLSEWLDSDLQDWGISRDKPYFGFQIPGFKDKYFYSRILRQDWARL
jgi:methionyl-tRNA synthetase